MLWGVMSRGRFRGGFPSIISFTNDNEDNDPDSPVSLVRISFPSASYTVLGRNVSMQKSQPFPPAAAVSGDARLFGVKAEGWHEGRGCRTIENSSIQ